jgi:hypothetical protein
MLRIHDRPFWALLMVLFLGTVPTVASGQLIGVRHAPDDTKAEEEWWKDYGDDVNLRRTGDLRRIDVPNGGKVCVQLIEPNTLLYQYALAASEEVTETPTGYTTLLSAVGGLFSKSTGMSFSVTRASDQTRGDAENDSIYKTAVMNLYETLPNEAATLIAASDAGPPGSLSSFGGVLDSLGRIIQQMQAAATQAATIRKGLGDRASSLAPFDVLEAEGVKKLATLTENVQKARENAISPVCAVVKDHPTRLHLSAKAIAPDAKPKRAVGDSIYAVSADPRVTDRTSIGVGGFIIPWVSGRRAFEADDKGIVRETKNQPLDPQVATFLQVRSMITPIWLQIGAGTGPGKKPTYLLGAVWRPQDIVGAKMDASLGVGMVYQTGTVVGLSDPAQLDAALPTGKTVNDVVTRAKRVGVGVTLSITGLDIESLISKP